MNTLGYFLTYVLNSKMTECEVILIGTVVE